MESGAKFGTKFSDGVRASIFAFARVRHDRSPTSQTFIYSHSDLAKIGFIETKELLRPKGRGLFARRRSCAGSIRQRPAVSPGARAGPTTLARRLDHGPVEVTAQPGL